MTGNGLDGGEGAVAAEPAVGRGVAITEDITAIGCTVETEKGAADLKWDPSVSQGAGNDRGKGRSGRARD